MEDEFDEVGYDIYMKCERSGIKSFDDDKDKETLRIIALSYGLTDFDDALKRCIKACKEEDNDKYERFLRNADKWKANGKNTYKDYFIKDPLSSSKQYFIYDLEKIEKKLFDDTNQDDKIGLFNFSNVSYDINIANDFEVNFTYKLQNDIQFANIPAGLCGILKIIVYDINNNIIADGLYGPNGFECGTYLKLGSKFEYSNSGSVKAICINQNDVKVNSNEEYRIDFKPYYLWFIEK